MRIAIVSDIHDNRTAFAAVLADLRQTSPDLILHRGIWRTVEPARWKLWIRFAVIEEMAAAPRAALGEDSLAWLSALPHTHIHGSMALVHASPETVWRAPTFEAFREWLLATQAA